MPSPMTKELELNLEKFINQLDIQTIDEVPTMSKVFDIVGNIIRVCRSGYREGHLSHNIILTTGAPEALLRAYASIGSNMQDQMDVGDLISSYLAELTPKCDNEMGTPLELPLEEQTKITSLREKCKKTFRTVTRERIKKNVESLSQEIMNGCPLYTEINSKVENIMEEIQRVPHNIIMQLGVPDALIKAWFIAHKNLPNDQRWLEVIRNIYIHLQKIMPKYYDQSKDSPDSDILNEWREIQAHYKEEFENDSLTFTLSQPSPVLLKRNKRRKHHHHDQCQFLVGGDRYQQFVARQPRPLASDTSSKVTEKEDNRKPPPHSRELPVAYYDLTDEQSECQFLAGGDRNHHQLAALQPPPLSPDTSSKVTKKEDDRKPPPHSLELPVAYYDLTDEQSVT